MAKSIYKLNLKVRDYECDVQGIVNNAVYQNYLEHARHEFLKSNGFSFIDLCRKGIILVLKDISIKYKAPLKNDDEFYVTTEVTLSGKYRLAFLQKIFNLKDNTLILDASLTVVCLINNKISRLPDNIIKKIGLYGIN